MFFVYIPPLSTLLPARLHSNGLYIFFSTNDNESLFILSQLLIQTQSGIFSAVFHSATSNHLDVTRYLLFSFVVYFSCSCVYVLVYVTLNDKNIFLVLGQKKNCAHSFEKSTQQTNIKHASNI